MTHSAKGYYIMNTHPVNETAKKTGGSPTLKFRVTDDYHQLIKRAADIAAAGNVSAFIKQSAIKEARQVIQSHDDVPTLAS